ncbi:MAG: VWA domain-containing protein [Terracidiphilus sp.]|nr:VWA domain-containing protein [Terracidiphilus sp.]MDR3775374.1 VWA domain-containing protein [Terracidiphilus sp.]
MIPSPGIWVSLFLCFPYLVLAQQDTRSNPLAPATPAAAATRISLDVLITGKDGKPLTGLEATDFTLLDNGQPRKILSFRRTDGTSGNQFDPPVEVIFVLDEAGLGINLSSMIRLDLENFLRRNGGHLSHPTSVFILSSKGLRTQATPSRDGTALAAELEKNKVPGSSAAFSDYVYGQGDEFRKSIDALSYIVTNEGKKPGKKILLWLGHGWPLLASNRSIATDESRQTFFKAIVSLSTKLREARMTIDCIFPAPAAPVRLSPLGTYEDYLKPVADWRNAEAPNLAVQVIAQHSGGRVFATRNDMPERIADCVAEAGAYYTLTFAPPTAERTDEYHDLKVQIARPGVTAHTNSGYYLQP